MGLIRRLWGFTRSHAPMRNGLLVCVVLRSIQLPILAWLLGKVIDGPVAAGDRTGLLWGTLGFIAFALFTQVTFHYRIRLALELGEAIVHDLRRAIFAHLQSLPMSFFHTTKLGRIISRMTSDVEAVRIGVQDVLFVSMVSLGQMLTALCMMFYCDWVLATMLVALAPVLWLLNSYFRRKLSDAHRAVQESFSRVTSTLAESVNGVRVTQGFVRQDANAKVFAGLVADHAGYNLDAAKTAGILLPLLELNSQLFMAGLLVVGGYRVLNPEVAMPVGSLIQFFFLANVFFHPIQILGNQYNQALTSMAGAERVFKLLDTKPAWQDAADARPLPRLAGQVIFDAVGFGYHPERPVLSDISFTAKPGQLIALVGHTGSGKTTLISLLARFYRPDTGKIILDGHDLAECQTASLRRQLGMVTQQHFLFGGTILDNIRVGRDGASEAEAIAALDQLGCRDLFTSLPDGLATAVGERGASLSLGQRQLVCFARALISDPRILILDEATSSVDTMTEVRLQAALARLLTGRTSFVIAHRLSTIRHADQVLVLDQGRIIERGTHASLVAASGTYAKLHEQFLRSGQA